MKGELFMLFVEAVKSCASAPLMADWILDNSPDHPEASRYIKWLQDWKTVKLSTLIEAVAKFGDKKSRKLIRKETRKAWKHKHLARVSCGMRKVVMSKRYNYLQDIGTVYHKVFYMKIVGSYG